MCVNESLCHVLQKEAQSILDRLLCGLGSPHFFPTSSCAYARQQHLEIRKAGPEQFRVCSFPILQYSGPVSRIILGYKTLSSLHSRIFHLQYT